TCLSLLSLQYKAIGATEWEEESEDLSPGEPVKTRYLLKGLKPSTNYSIQVRLMNKVNSSDWVGAQEPPVATLDKERTYFPKLTLKSATANSVILQWSPPPPDVSPFVQKFKLKATEVDSSDGQTTKEDQLNIYDRRTQGLFDGLRPGTSYKFQVTACNGYTEECGMWSLPLEASTLDGGRVQEEEEGVEIDSAWCTLEALLPFLVAGPPLDVTVTCKEPLPDTDEMRSVVITWNEPEVKNGRITYYQIFLEITSRYPDASGMLEEDDADTKVISAQYPIQRTTYVGTPNSNYSVQICAVTGSSVCGRKSLLTSQTKCSMLPAPPDMFPSLSWYPSGAPAKSQEFHDDNEDQEESPDGFGEGTLTLRIPSISQRNGKICCFRVIMVRLLPGDDGSQLPPTSEISISTYRDVHSDVPADRGAYVAEMFSGPRIIPRVVLGDSRLSGDYEGCNKCFDGKRRKRRRRAHAQDNGPFFHQRRRARASVNPLDHVHDGPLDSESTYRGFLEVIVLGGGRNILRKRSPYFSRKPALDGDLADPTEGSEGSTTADIVTIFLGICVGVLLVMVVLLSLCVFRRYSKLVARQEVEISFLQAPIPVGKVVDAFVSRHRETDTGFRQEFQLLPERFPDRSTRASEDSHNSAKNRYPDIKAYDQTRVVLPTLEDIPCSDYINANHVQGFREKKKFICAQGPLLGTVADFWRMIWEEGVETVVMLTNFEENGKVKCCRYWSDGKSEDDIEEELDDSFGPTQVTCVAEKTYSDYVLRRLRAERPVPSRTKSKDSSASSESDPMASTSTNKKEVREIQHFHYLVWKDFMAPEHPAGLLKFIKRVNQVHWEMKKSTPILIHCSAGVGRTGTFVAIDSLVDEMKQEGRASVFSTVSNLRHQRNYLVQSIKQYIFVYRALMEYFQLGDTEVESLSLMEHVDRGSREIAGRDNGEMAPLKKEFSKLREVVEDKRQTCFAVQEKNSLKNRSRNYIPFDHNRVILSHLISRPEETYINASFMQGYDHSMGYIITQDPMSSTILDFWRMILDQSVATIVMLSADVQEEEEDKNEGERTPLVASSSLPCWQYWPDDGVKQFDHIKVEITHMETLPRYIKRSFKVINTKSTESCVVTQYQFLAWEGNLCPAETEGLLDLVSQVAENQDKENEPGPVVIHCSNGDRSSIFLAASIVLQQLTLEGRVDVFQTVRNIRSQRMGMIQDYSQYAFLYQCLLDHLRIQQQRAALMPSHFQGEGEGADEESAQNQTENEQEEEALYDSVTS
ncbi:unnamed protein product, partial [Cyprideis torosa]